MTLYSASRDDGGATWDGAGDRTVPWSVLIWFRDFFFIVGMRGFVFEPKQSVVELFPAGFAKVRFVALTFSRRAFAGKPRISGLRSPLVMTRIIG